MIAHALVYLVPAALLFYAGWTVLRFPLPIALGWVPVLLFAKVLVCFPVPHTSTA